MSTVLGSVVVTPSVPLLVPPSERGRCTVPGTGGASGASGSRSCSSAFDMDVPAVICDVGCSVCCLSSDASAKYFWVVSWAAGSARVGMVSA